MESPEYRLDFEVTTYFDIKDDFEEKNWDGSRIVFLRSKGTNKGFIIYQTDNLNQHEALEEGKKRVNTFLNYLLIASNMDNIAPTKFAETPKLLNPDKFKGMTMTKSITGSAIIGANFQNQWAESATNLFSRAHKLSDNKHTAIDRCLFWLRKGAEAETNSNEKFIYRMVSFEALSGFLESKNNWCNSLIGKMREENARAIFEKYRKLFDELVDASLEDWHGHNRSEKLKHAITRLERGEVDHKAVMMKTAWCIYEVRNKFLHGGEAMSLIGSCNTLLRELIHALLKDLLHY